MEATTNIHLIFELSLYSLNTSLQDFVELGHLIETQASSPDRQHPAQKKTDGFNEYNDQIQPFVIASMIIHLGNAFVLSRSLLCRILGKRSGVPMFAANKPEVPPRPPNT